MTLFVMLLPILILVGCANKRADNGDVTVIKLTYDEDRMVNISEFVKSIFIRKDNPLCFVR
jgi:hypothetical protein